MVTPLAIDKMTTEEKLQTMEALWDDLCQHEEALTVPEAEDSELDSEDRFVDGGTAEAS